MWLYLLCDELKHPTMTQMLAYPSDVMDLVATLVASATTRVISKWWLWCQTSWEARATDKSEDKGSVNGQLITVICREASSDWGCHWSAPRQPFLAALPWLQGHSMSQAPFPRSWNPDCLIWNGIPSVEKKKNLENAFLLLLYNWNPVPNFIKLWGYEASWPTYLCTMNFAHFGARQNKVNGPISVRKSQRTSFAVLVMWWFIEIVW